MPKRKTRFCSRLLIPWKNKSDAFVSFDAHVTPQVLAEVEEGLKGQRIDAVICVAGGWAGGNATDDG
jgi:hypothetical protein